MLNKVLKGIAVFLIAAVLTVTILPLTNQWVSAAEGDLAETNEATNESDDVLGREFGMGKRHRIRAAEDLDGDGYPDLPEGFTRPCDTDGDGVPDLPDGLTPRWSRGRVSDFDDTSGRPFRGHGRQGTAAAQTP